MMSKRRLPREGSLNLVTIVLFAKIFYFGVKMTLCDTHHKHKQGLKSSVPIMQQYKTA